jgi:hypothetical protein
LDNQAAAKLKKMLKQIRELIHENRRCKIRELAYTVEISDVSLQVFLGEHLNTHHIAAKFVPRHLTNDQKQRRVNVS